MYFILLSSVLSIEKGRSTVLTASTVMNHNVKGVI